ncbi:MAG TPA: hypothetical protein VGF24_07720 [Vicinamibacterales bacterium]
MASFDARSAASRSSSWWHWVLLVALLPATLTVALPDWVYSTPGTIDAWVYHGFFRHLESYSSAMFPGTYYGSRLGWIVPGYVAYHVFPAWLATIILHLTFYVLAVCSLYVIVRRAAGSSNALFTALLFGLYVPPVRAIGSDYVDGAVIAYALLTVALGVYGIETSSRWPIFASGAAVGAMLNSNVGAVLLLPPIAVWLVPLQRSEWLAEPLRRRAALWCAGVAVCTMTLSFISVMTGGTWDFFLQSLRWLEAMRMSNPWDVHGLSWVGISPWVFLPLATTVSIVVCWFRWPDDHTDPGRIRAIGSLVLVVTIFAIWDFVGSGSLLAFPYYASWLVPWTFIAIGVVLIPPLSKLGLDATVLSLTALIVAGSLRLFVHVPGFGLTALWLTIGVVVIAAFARHTVASRILIAVIVACLNGWMASTGLYALVGDRADGFDAIDRSVKAIDRYLSVSQPRFLLASPMKLSSYVTGLTSVYLWGYTIASDRYPTVTAAQAALIVPGTTVVVIAEYADAAKSFDDVFAPFGLRGVRKGSERIETQHGSLYLTFLEARARTVS